MAKKKAKERVIKGWSKNEIKLLKKLYPTSSTLEVAKKIGRSPASVLYGAYILEIKKKRVSQARPDIPPNEIKLLKKLYPTTENREIAERLGWSMRKVRLEAFFLGLIQGM